MSDHDRSLCERCLTADYEEFVHHCIHESMAKNEVWNAEFDIADLPRWDYSDVDHTLSFSKDGKPRLVCDVIIAGTTKYGRWQWTWGNQVGAAIDREATRAVFELGEAKGWAGITDLFQDADEHTGWECVSVANHVLDGQANYRFQYGDDDEYFAYLVILRTHRVN